MAGVEALRELDRLVAKRQRQANTVDTSGPSVNGDAAPPAHDTVETEPTELDADLVKIMAEAMATELLIAAEREAEATELAAVERKAEEVEFDAIKREVDAPLLVGSRRSRFRTWAEQQSSEFILASTAKALAYTFAQAAGISLTTSNDGDLRSEAATYKKELRKRAS